MDTETLWETVLAELQLTLSPADFKTWFADTTPLEYSKGVLTIGCPSSFAKERLEKRHLHQIQTLCKRIIKRPIKITFVIATKQTTATIPLGPLFSHGETAPRQNKITGLSSHFKLDNFVVGSNNRLAYAVSVGVVEAPGKNYNPFFLYSSVGLGKTHLIQAIGNAVLERYQKMRVVYCTGESFTNGIITAIQNRTQAAFRRKYRDTDVLLIDDVQFIAGRETTQEEFFNTFNALYLSNKQVVLTSDKPPKEIANLEERLSSRFVGGMIADMQPPDFDMRVAILKEKAKQHNKEIPAAVLEIIAGTISSNIRELEGALRQVITGAAAEGAPLTPETAAKVLRASRALKETTRVSPREIINNVCTHFAITPKELRGPRRQKELVLPRQIAMYLIRDLTEIPLTEIGELLGGRDHTTIIHGVGKIERRISEEPLFEKQISTLKRGLQ